MIQIDKRLILLLILFTVTAWRTPGNQENSYPAPAQGEHRKRIYIAADGKRYIARQLPVYIQISSTPDGKDAVLLEEKNVPPSTAALLLPEGLNILKRTGPTLTNDIPSDHGNETGYEIYIDGTPPQTTSTFSRAPVYEKEGNHYYGKGLVLELVSRDLLAGVQEVYLSVNGKPYAPLSGPFSDFPTDTLIHLQHYAVDNVGNVEKPVETVFYLDVTPPHSQWQVKGNHETGTLSPGSVLELSANDNLSGVKEIYYKWDDRAESVYSASFTPAELTEGYHTLDYYAVDQTGNVEEKQSQRFFYDKSAPVVSVSWVGDKGEREGIVFVSRNTRIKMEATDNHAGTAAIHLSIDAGPEQTYEDPFPLPLPGGIHKIKYQAIDRVGNESEPQTLSVYLDIIPPDTQYQISGYYASSQKNIVLRKDVPVFLVSTDLEAGVKEIRYRIDGGEPSIYKDFLKFETNGEHTLAYWGVDGANNQEEEKKLELRVDNSLKKTAGETSLDRYPPQWYVNDKGELTGTVAVPFYLVLSTSDKPEDQGYLLDLPKLGTDTGQPITFRKGGTMYLQLQAGGPDGRADIFQVQVDALPPVTKPVFSGAKTYETRGEVYFGPGLTAAFQAQDNPKGIVSGYRETYVSLDDSPFFIYKAPLTIFSREKAYRFRFYSVDNVGNAEEIRTMMFTIDTTPPVTTWQVSGMTQGRILSTQSRIQLSAVDNLTGVKDIFYRFDEQKEKKYAHALEASELNPLSDGEHVLFFYALDQTGNQEKTGELSFFFDKAEHIVELKVSGDRYDKGDVVFISLSGRLGFTSTGDQTPINIIMYRVNGGQETRYTNSFFQLAGQKGKHVLTYWGSDALGNTSKLRNQVIFIDAEPPQTQLKIAGPVFRNRYNTFLCSKTMIELTAVDGQTGVKAIYYGIDGTPPKEYRGPFSIQSGGKHTLTYYASDMVNNSEKHQQITFYIDNEPPDLQVTHNVEPRKDPVNGVLVFPPGLIIGFSAMDAQTDVDKIIYRFDNGKEHLYRNLVSDFEAGKVYSLQVYALDRLGNKREQTIVFRVE